MRNRFFCNLAARRHVSKETVRTVFFALVALLAAGPSAHAGDAPAWMHAAANAPLPPHDDKANAVLLYSETNVNVLSADKIKTQERRVYKILRPDGRDYGTVVVPFRSPGEKVNNLKGWCIPAQGKDFEVKDKEAIEASLPKVAGSELITDVRVKVLDIPAPDVGNIVGYEYELEESPLLLQRRWRFQREPPTAESRFSLQLPSGWTFKTYWLNHAEIPPSAAGANQWQWSVSNLPGIRPEADMPPLAGVAGTMIVNLLPPGGPAAKGFANWQQMGTWYSNLTATRRQPSPEIAQKVSELVAGKTTPLQKMQAIADFVQHNIRYVAIELGIGGMQPHPAADIFAHQYGDCKDKATLTSSMLQQVGIDSYYVVINSERGAVTPEMPANSGFDHVILAVKLPPEITDPSLNAVLQDPTLGKILIFDPTDQLTPFGQISGNLQANYGLLVTPTGGELIEVPKQPSAMNSIRRTGNLTLDAAGNLKGDVEEVRLGDRAWGERWALRHVSSDRERIKPIEALLSASLSNFQILKASVVNLMRSDQPFGFRYSFQAESYAKNAGGFLLVRPRVLGVKAEGILETSEPRRYPIEFDAPVQDTDTFLIKLPAGYVVDDMPPPVDADFGFASYHSKTVVNGDVLSYSRTFEIKELSVPVARAADLKKFYRIIAGDERNTAILKPAAQ